MDENILLDLVKECSKELNLKSIIQFGSSTYSKDAKDVDLLFVSNEEVVPIKDFLKLRKIIKNFENKYKEVVFDFGGLGRKRQVKYSITVVLFGKKDLDVEHNPHDLFFFKNLRKDNNKKVLFGENVFVGKDFNLTNQHLFEMLSVDLKHSLRTSLDDEKYLFEGSYFLFKTFLRGMLVNEKEDLKKEELTKVFKKKFGKEIKLPKNSKEILEKRLKKEDFEDILKFSEDCLKFLSR